VTINNSVKVGGVLLQLMKRDGASDMFHGKEGVPKYFWIGMEGIDDL